MALGGGGIGDWGRRMGLGVGYFWQGVWEGEGLEWGKGGLRLESAGFVLPFWGLDGARELNYGCSMDDSATRGCESHDG